MEHRISILFYSKKKKITKDNLVPIYMRITINGQRLEHSTHRYVPVEKWSSATGRMKGNMQEARILNAYLDALTNKVHTAEREMTQDGLAITYEAFKEKWIGTSERSRMLLEIFEQHNKEMKQLIGKDFEKATHERYQTSKDHTKSFLKWKYNLEDIDIKKLDYQFICDYEFWLKTERNCAHNTTMKYLSNFRKIVNICLDRGWLQRNPFSGYKMKKKPVNREALTEEEVQTIIQKRLVSARLEQVRDIFIFSCFTGLAYADVKKLTQREIGIGIDGKRWIHTYRQKTKTNCSIPILPMAATIMSQYQDHPQYVQQDRVLPILSNQKMNAYLKEIADVCGITKVLTFHIARHTFATIAVSNGVPMETVSKILGHKRIVQTQHYAKINDRKIGDDMEAMEKKFNSNAETVNEEHHPQERKAS